MFLGLAFGPSLIRRLRELQIGQLSARKAEEHKKRPARPTMGGVLIVVDIAVPSTAC